MAVEGGGASRSTDPAAGSSAATDVSLREYVAVLVASLDRHLTAELQALRRETAEANRTAEKAIHVAALEASERLAAHNGLIEQMQDAQAHFASREMFEAQRETVERRFSRLERFQAMLTGGLLLISAIGVANLVKVWAQ